MVHQPRPIAGQKSPDGIPLGGAVPMSPLERNPLPTRGWRPNRDTGGVGLAIAVALEEGDGGGRATKPHSTAPIVIGSQRNNNPLVCLPQMSEFGAPASCCASRPPPPAVSAEEFFVDDFLSSCLVCRKKLLGKDIFMYREKPFCSEECRHQQMVNDEYQEKCGARAPKRSAVAEITSSPCSGGQLFFAGIAVS